jgi:hypothetical protein
MQSSFVRTLTGVRCSLLNYGRSFSKIPRSAVVLAFLVLSGCHSSGPLDIIGPATGPLSIKVGQELQITMRTVGPGQYISPPGIAGSSLLFVDMQLPPAQVPAGVTQVFRFRGSQAGQSVIQFRNTADHPDVMDTVIVR